MSVEIRKAIDQFLADQQKRLTPVLEASRSPSPISLNLQMQSGRRKLVKFNYDGEGRCTGAEVEEVPSC